MCSHVLRKMLGVLLDHFPLCFVRQGFSLTWSSPVHLGRLAVELPRSTHLHLLLYWGYKHTLLLWGFICILEILIQV